MKKLTIAACAALCATVGFAETTVQAPEVVGYSGLTLKAFTTDFSILSFQNIGTTEAKTRIGDIAVPGEMHEGWEDWWFAGENGDYISTIGDYGAQLQCYTWNPYHNEYEGCWVKCDNTGTYPEEDYEIANDDLIPMNQAIIVYSANGAKLTLAGKVLQGDNAFYMPAFETVFTGNFTPAPFKLGDIVVPGEQHEGWEDWWFAGENGDYISTIGEYGAQLQCYTWNPYHNEYEGCWVECDNTGTYPEEGYVIANNVEIDPNTALIAYSANGAEINIPNAIK